MTDALHHIAAASLPVAIGLLALTVAARVVLWAGVGDERLARAAREYLGPLSIWCLILVAVHTVALGGAGELGAGSGGVALIIGAAAVLLRAEDGGLAEEEEAGDAPDWAVAAGERAARAGVAARSERAAAPAPASRSLWVEPGDEPAPRTGLWS